MHVPTRPWARTTAHPPSGSPVAVTELMPSLRTSSAGRLAATSPPQLNQVDCRTFSLVYLSFVCLLPGSFSIVILLGHLIYFMHLICAGIVAALNVAMDSFEEKSYYERLRSALYSASDDRVSINKNKTNFYFGFSRTTSMLSPCPGLLPYSLWFVLFFSSAMLMASFAR